MAENQTQSAICFHCKPVYNPRLQGNLALALKRGEMRQAFTELKLMAKMTPSMNSSCPRVKLFSIWAMALALALSVFGQAPSTNGIIDTLVLGDAASEQSHGLTQFNSEIV